MAKKLLLWVEVGAHAVRNRPKCGGVGWACAGVAWRLGVCIVFEATWAVWRRQLSLLNLLDGAGSRAHYVARWEYWKLVHGDAARC
jgi:hypothetical protein